MASSTAMIAVLDVPEIRDRVLRVSLADYHRYSEGQRTELLRGIVIEKMSRAPLDSFVAEALREILSERIGPDLIALQERPLTTSDSEPEPDVMVVRGARSDFRDHHPTTAELVVEVAISSVEIDRVKAMIYAEAGVSEYWIVCPVEKLVEVYRKPTPQGYAERTTVMGSVVLECAALPGVQVDFGALFS